MTELEIILRLQQIGCRALDYIMYFLTQFGDETFFLLVSAVIFWCINKRFGYKFIIVFMSGQLAAGALKTIFERPRPFEKGARAVIDKSDGYSFPSGHSQNIANIATQTTLYAHKNWPSRFKPVIITGVSAVIVVMFTRMYLGQHYLTDVIAGAALGVIVALISSRLFEFLGTKEERLMFVLLPLSIIFAVALRKHGDDIAKVAAVLGSVSLGYFLEKRYVNYDVKSKKRYHYILKVLIGGIVLIGLKEGIKLIGTELKLGDVWLFILTYIRYFLIGITASLLAPLTFKALKI